MDDRCRATLSGANGEVAGQAWRTTQQIGLPMYPRRDMPPAERMATRALIRRHLPDLAEDYDALITLADLEFGS
ncbi:MAG TPA: hypothetical protein VEZ12_14890 [Herpetosiphonaceae bacterium]|nr:hypothetical protein [Herpetosiphonaceae bacterium]